LLVDEGFERPWLMEANVYAAEFEREDGGSGEKVH
jgi:hypothetical protein